MQYQTLLNRLFTFQHIIRPNDEVNENVPSGSHESVPSRRADAEVQEDVPLPDQDWSTNSVVEGLYEANESEERPLRLRLRSTSTNNQLPIPSTSASQASPIRSNGTHAASSAQTLTGDNSLNDFINELFEDTSESNRQIGDDDIVAAFGVICGFQDRKPLDTNVLEYWHAKRYSNPILYKLAVVVHAVPATQVSVERCFSVLKFILNDYRSCMRSDTLENLMLLKLNAGLESKFL